MVPDLEMERDKCPDDTVTSQSQTGTPGVPEKGDEGLPESHTWI